MAGADRGCWWRHNFTVSTVAVHPVVSHGVQRMLRNRIDLLDFFLCVLSNQILLHIFPGTRAQVSDRGADGQPGHPKGEVESTKTGA